MWPLNNVPQNSVGNPNGFKAPQPNANFSRELAQVQAKLVPNMPGGPNLSNPNLPFQPMSWQPALYEWKVGDDYFAGLTKGGGKDGVGGKDGKDGSKTGPLSGKGSIDGVNFKSGDGERYELKVESGKSYNLLSDAGIGLNGTYGKDSSGETVLTDIALSVGGKIVTLADDGTLRVDGKAFDKKKNNLEGLVTENKNGTYTVKANGYEFELKASENGIKVKIDAKNARTPEGLWGVALDGDKQTERELQKSIKESDYKIDDALTFDYEDNNNIGEKYMPDLDDEERSAMLFNGRNPQSNGEYHQHWVGIGESYADKGSFVSHGGADTEDDRYWNMTALNSTSFYNVFSDEALQVNGKFLPADASQPNNRKLKELGIVLDGTEVSVVRNGTGIKVMVDGTELKEGETLEGISLKSGVLSFSSDQNGEKWDMTVAAEGTNALSFRADSRQVGFNSTRSTGLLGDAISTNPENDNGNDLNGAGYLRNADGSLSKAGQDMNKALREYIVDDQFDTGSGRSAYE